MEGAISRPRGLSSFAAKMSKLSKEEFSLDTLELA